MPELQAGRPMTEQKMQLHQKGGRQAPFRDLADQGAGGA